MCVRWSEWRLLAIKSKRVCVCAVGGGVVCAEVKVERSGGSTRGSVINGSWYVSWRLRRGKRKRVKKRKLTLKDMKKRWHLERSATMSEPTEKTCIYLYTVCVSPLSVLNPASPSLPPSPVYKPTLLPLNKNHLPVFYHFSFSFPSIFSLSSFLHCGLPLIPDWVGAVMGQNSDVTAVIFKKGELIGWNHRGAGIQVSENEQLGLLLALACVTSGERIWDKLC